MNVTIFVRLLCQASVILMAYVLAGLPIWQFILVGVLFMLVERLKDFGPEPEESVIDEDHYA